MSEDGEIPPPSFCSVCRHTKSKYKCPACEARTCSLQCCKKHKVKSNCNGQRDPTKSATLKQDYNYLEETIRSTEVIQKRLVGITGLPDALRYKLLKQQSRKLHSIDLRLAPKIFLRHRENLSFYSVKDKVIYWTIEFMCKNIQIAQVDPMSSKLTLREIIVQNDLFSSQLLAQHSINIPLSLNNLKITWFTTKVITFTEQPEYKFKFQKKQNNYNSGDLSALTETEVQLDQTLEDILSGNVVNEFPTFILDVI